LIADNFLIQPDLLTQAEFPTNQYVLLRINEYCDILDVTDQEVNQNNPLFWIAYTITRGCFGKHVRAYGYLEAGSINAECTIIIDIIKPKQHYYDDEK